MSKSTIIARAKPYHVTHNEERIAGFPYHVMKGTSRARSFKTPKEAIQDMLRRARAIDPDVELWQPKAKRLPASKPVRPKITTEMVAKAEAEAASKKAAARRAGRKSRPYRINPARFRQTQDSNPIAQIWIATHNLTLSGNTRRALPHRARQCAVTIDDVVMVDSDGDPICFSEPDAVAMARRLYDEAPQPKLPLGQTLFYENDRVEVHFMPDGSSDAYVALDKLTREYVRTARGAIRRWTFLTTAKEAAALMLTEPSPSERLIQALHEAELDAEEIDRHNAAVERQRRKEDALQRQYEAEEAALAAKRVPLRERYTFISAKPPKEWLDDHVITGKPPEGAVIDRRMGRSRLVNMPPKEDRIYFKNRAEAKAWEEEQRRKADEEKKQKAADRKARG